MPERSGTTLAPIGSPVVPDEALPDLDVVALRTASTALRDVFAMHASADRWTWRALVDRLRDDRLSARGLDPSWATRLARVIALQGTRPGDQDAALAVYHGVHEAWGPDLLPPPHAKLFSDLMLLSHEDVLLDAALPGLPLTQEERGLIRADLENPHRGGPLAKPEALWRERFRRAARFPMTTELLPTTGETAAFDSLNARSRDRGALGHTLVTVVMNVFRPDDALLGAVKSLLAQTWQELEILMVDDGSGLEFANVFRRAADLDPRVRLLTLPENRGAYGARNHALHHARGTFLTFQDYDDWSVPDRVAEQVAVLEGEPGLVATRGRTTKVYEDLTLAHPGYRPDQVHAASLMFRRAEVVLGIGYFDEARKAADNEFLNRLRAYFGPQACLDVPRSHPSLLAYRRTQGSLSRDEFRPGWRHPSRSTYWNNYLYWHQHVSREALHLEPNEQRRFPAPRRFLAASPERSSFDVVLVADWRVASVYTELGTDLIDGFIDAAWSVALLGLEAPENFVVPEPSLLQGVQQRVQRGEVEVVDLDLPLNAGLVLIVDPSTLTWVDGEPTPWEVRRTLLLDHSGDVAPRVSDVAASCFGPAPERVPASRVYVASDGRLVTAAQEARG